MLCTCPEGIGADNGSKNGHVANTQVFHADTFSKDNSLICGHSTGGKYEENIALSSRISMFKAFQENGHFSGDFFE